MITFVVTLCDNMNFIFQMWSNCKFWQVKTMRINSWKGSRQSSLWRWEGQRAKELGCWASASILMSCGVLAGHGMERNLRAGSLMSERVMLGSWVAGSEEEWEEAWLHDMKLKGVRYLTQEYRRDDLKVSLESEGNIYPQCSPELKGLVEDTASAWQGSSTVLLRLSVAKSQVGWLV